MIYPTLICTRISGALFATGGVEPAETAFNQVILKNAVGSWIGTFGCNPDLSTFLPGPMPVYLNADQFNELWPLCLSILVVGFLTRLLLRAF